MFGDIWQCDRCGFHTGSEEQANGRKVDCPVIQEA